ncbi:uncharacterized protein CXorf65 homolog isoform X1 [Ictalurus punctatus]|uniref:Uncharacterized protein CXorf65 homolog isoform X1 n=1 Tax=Ictalurus punctatus TaxID=7998 RepID=A0A2D0RGJ6_ICTPU|nr:uncharacterized protein CXorf65 homolog isoform X1 [Ictalurus punctatus]
MFVYIKHGDNEQFLVNTNCSIICLLQYVRSKLKLTDTDLVDLCDERGALLSLSGHRQGYASQILTPRKTYIICTINRSSEGAYVSITPHVANLDSVLQGVLQSGVVSLEQTRRKNLHALGGRKTAVQTPAQKQPVRLHNPASK